jgi:hypothetical protein
MKKFSNSDPEYSISQDRLRITFKYHIFCHKSIYRGITLRSLRNYGDHWGVTCIVQHMLCPMYTICILIKCSFDTAVMLMKLYSGRIHFPIYYLYKIKCKLPSKYILFIAWVDCVLQRARHVSASQDHYQGVKYKTIPVTGREGP